MVSEPQPRRLSRRELLLGAAVGLLSACSRGSGTGQPTESQSPQIGQSSPGSETLSPPPSPGKPLRGFRSGMTLTSWTKGELGDPDKGEKQIQKIAETGANLLSFIPTSYQDGPKATVIYQDQEKTSSNEEVADGIRQAHDLGMAVLLKPHVDSPDNTWRGEFGAGFDAKQRDQWFKSYKEFIVPYAKLAQENGVEICSVGCEFKALSGYADQWREIVNSVRDVYHGEVTYAANYDEPIQWYDAVDIIGVDDYSPVTTVNATAATIASFWQDRVAQYSQYAKKLGKPFMLTEFGCSSSVGGWKNPNEPTSNTADQDVQAIWYGALYNAILQKPGALVGVAGWQWYPYSIPHPEQDTGLTIQGKRAEVVFTNFNRQHVRQRRAA
jgi:hypothetical protein